LPTLGGMEPGDEEMDKPYKGDDEDFAPDNFEVLSKYVSFLFADKRKEIESPFYEPALVYARYKERVDSLNI
jgi:hypothetical protein